MDDFGLKKIYKDYKARIPLQKKGGQSPLTTTKKHYDLF